jgi:hypothetical protein
MPNSSLENQSFKVSDELRSTLKKNLEKYGKDNPKGSKRARKMITNPTVNYNEMKRMKTYFDNYDGDGSDVEYKLNGGDLGKDWVESTLNTARDTVDGIKRTRMDAGEENQFKKTHEKDKDNANPTGVGMVKIHKGSDMRNIMNNTTVYEEIKQIKELIEYLK